MRGTGTETDPGTATAGAGSESAFLLLLAGSADCRLLGQIRRFGICFSASACWGC